MFKRFIIFVSIIFIMVLPFSCAKKEPAQNPDSDILANKISEKFNDLSVSLDEGKAKELFDENNDADFSKIENFSVKQSEYGETGIFKLYSDVNADYVKAMAAKRILKLQAEAGGLDNQAAANNAEVRSYGNYVYYVSHGEKDKIFKIIEDELQEK